MTRTSAAIILFLAVAACTSATMPMTWTRPDGRAIDAALVRATIPRQLEKIRTLIGPARFDAGKFELASGLFERMMTSEDFPDFLTLAAYDYLD